MFKHKNIIYSTFVDCLKYKIKGKLIISNKAKLVIKPYNMVETKSLDLLFMIFFNKIPVR